MLYRVACGFKDGSTSRYDGLTLNDMLAVIERFDVLVVEWCFISPEVE